MTTVDFNNIVEYLKDKKVTFAVKEDFRDNSLSIVGVAITKTDRFFRANGVIIAGNFAQYFI